MHGSRHPLPTHYFALAVVRCGHRFLLVQERKYGETWSIPGGRVEAGETLATAAIREVLEESGVPIRLDGIYRVEHTAHESSARVRIIYSGSPLDDTPPKTTADDESLRAAWLTIGELRQLPLRGADLRPLLEAIANGERTPHPLDLLGHELSV